MESRKSDWEKVKQEPLGRRKVSHPVERDESTITTFRACSPREHQHRGERYDGHRL
jgi:hypothetical protein